MYPSDYKVSLRLWHPNVTPEEMGERLGLVPEFSFRAGEAPESYGCFLLPREEGAGPREVMLRHVEQLEAQRRFLKRFGEGGGRAEYYVTCAVQGAVAEVFDWRLLERLGRLRIDLSVETFERSEETRGQAREESKKATRAKRKNVVARKAAPAKKAAPGRRGKMGARGIRD